MNNQNFLEEIANIYSVTYSYYNLYASSQSLPKMKPNIANLQDLTITLKQNLPLSLDRPYQTRLASNRFCLDTLLLPFLKKSIFRDGEYNIDITVRNKLVLILKILGSILKMVKGRKYLERWILISMSALFQKIGENKSSQKILQLCINYSDTLALTPILGNVQELNKIFTQKNKQKYSRWRDKESLKENKESYQLSREDALLEIRARLFFISSISICYAQPSQIGQINELVQFFFACKPKQLEDLSQLKNIDIRYIDYLVSEQNVDKFPCIKIYESEQLKRMERLIVKYPETLINSEFIPDIERDVKYVCKEMKYDTIEFLVIDPDITEFEIFVFKKSLRINYDACDFEHFKDISTALQYIEKNDSINYSIIINAKYLTEATWIQKCLHKLLKFYYYGELLPEIKLPVSYKIKQLKTRGLEDKIEFREDIKTMKLAEDIFQELLHYNIASFTPNFTIVNSYDKNIDFNKAQRSCQFLGSLLSPTNHKQSVKNFISLVKAGQNCFRKEEQEILQRIQSLPFDEYLKHVIEDYKKETFFYKILNRGLRSLSKQKYWPYIQYPVSALFFEIRNRYLKHFHPQQRKYYRCCYLNKDEIQFLKIKGNIFRTEGFFSTSKNRQAAQHFGDYLFILTVPKNTTDTNIAGFADIQDQKLMGENETLFNPGNYFKVTNFREVDNQINKNWRSFIKVEIEADLIFIDQLEKKQLEATESEKDLISHIRNQKYIYSNLSQQKSQLHQKINQNIEMIGKRIIKDEKSLKQDICFCQMVNIEEILEESGDLEDAVGFILQEWFLQYSRNTKEAQKQLIRYLLNNSCSATFGEPFLYQLYRYYASEGNKQQCKKILNLYKIIAKSIMQVFAKNTVPFSKRFIVNQMKAIVYWMKFDLCESTEEFVEIQNIQDEFRDPSPLLNMIKQSELNGKLRDGLSKQPLRLMRIALKSQQSLDRVIQIYEQKNYFFLKYLKEQAQIVSEGSIPYIFMKLMITGYFSLFKLTEKQDTRQQILSKILRLLETLKFCISKVANELQRQKMNTEYSLLFSEYVHLLNKLETSLQEYLAKIQQNGVNKFYKMNNLAEILLADHQNKEAALYCYYQAQKSTQNHLMKSITKMNILTTLRDLKQFQLAYDKIIELQDQIQGQPWSSYSNAALVLEEMGEIEKSKEILLKIEMYEGAKIHIDRNKYWLRILSYGDLQRNLSRFKVWNELQTQEQIRIMQQSLDIEKSPIFWASLTASSANQIIKCLRLLYLSNVQKYYLKDINLYKKAKQILFQSKIFKEIVSINISSLTKDMYQFYGEDNYRIIMKKNIEDLYRLLDLYSKQHTIVMGYDEPLFGYLCLNDQKLWEIKSPYPVYIWMKMEPIIVQKVKETKKEEFCQWAALLYLQLRRFFSDFPDIIFSIDFQVSALMQNHFECITPLFENPKIALEEALNKKIEEMKKNIKFYKFDCSIWELLKKQYENFFKLPKCQKSSISFVFQSLGNKFEQQSNTFLSKRSYQLALQACYYKLVYLYNTDFSSMIRLLKKLKSYYSQNEQKQIREQYEKMINLTKNLKKNEDDIFSIKEFFEGWKNFIEMDIDRWEKEEMHQKFTTQIKKTDFILELEQLFEHFTKNFTIPSFEIVNNFTEIFMEYFIHTRNHSYFRLLEQNTLKCLKFHLQTKQIGYYMAFQNQVNKILGMLTLYKIEDREKMKEFYLQMQGKFLPIRKIKDREQFQKQTNKDKIPLMIFEQYLMGKYPKKIKYGHPID